MAIDSRSWARLWARYLKPWPSSPSRLATGTRTSLKNSSAVSWLCMPIFSSLRPRSKPGMPRSTHEQRHAGVALRRVGLGGDDHEVGVDAVGDERLGAVERRTRRRRGRAVVAMPARSEPVPGSVIAIAVISSPEAMPGSQRWRLLVVAVLEEVRGARRRCAASGRGPTPPMPARANSSAITWLKRKSSVPPPPYCSGIAMPGEPVPTGRREHLARARAPAARRRAAVRALDPPPRDRAAGRVTYSAGDHLGVLPRNGVELLRRVFSHFKLDASVYVTITPSSDASTHLPVNEPVPLIGILASLVELQDVATRPQMETLAQHTGDPAAARPAAGAGRGRRRQPRPLRERGPAPSQVGARPARGRAVVRPAVRRLPRDAAAAAAPLLLDLLVAAGGSEPPAASPSASSKGRPGAAGAPTGASAPTTWPIGRPTAPSSRSSASRRSRSSRRRTRTRR